MQSWHLIHTKIRQERLALDNLERQGFECFLPTIQAEKLRGAKLRVVTEALFPRYLFIRLSTSLNAQSWAPIRSTLGVSKMVAFGHNPAKIDDALLSALRARTDRPKEVSRHFEPGAPVLVTDGPFAGLEAIYQAPDGEHRIMVLLNLLSKPVKLAVSPASIRKLN